MVDLHLKMSCTRGSGHEFYSLNMLTALKKLNTPEVKKLSDLHDHEQNFDGKAINNKQIAISLTLVFNIQIVLSVLLVFHTC